MVDLDIIYCDNHLLAVNKPPALLTQPAPVGKAPNLEDMVKAWIKEEFNKPGNVFLHAVHRLDRDASGIVVFARTSKALSRMNALIRDRQVVKKYEAMVSPTLTVDEGELRHWHQHARREAKVTRRKSPGAKEAVLCLKELRRHGDHSLLEITLVTGRYHQIRAQLAFEGMPIVGDKKYGGRRTVTKGIYLHHKYMAFTHPVGGQAIELKAEVPPMWKKGIQYRPAPPTRGGSREKKRR